ncbi:amonabactin biosynthesis phosphopantetheinyl transferase AmoD [Aeromonas piscicola]|uniref:amonabactin biosynthesis phosphopantetheinyl transferase AmoD n=1 Tax=Aeromonas piscicola TaxID=600645 RepID=UPI0021F88129|nr:amonabactin biosynthesis phosphopantetheinyl transferase AmoD [Aeromonas piscicola]MCW0506844.1 amonabactin biosynthesis phosphopantetheinyl transferase AmoD [Aeromonas piscicola]
MPIAPQAAGSRGSFILQADCLPLPSAAHIALQRVCFDPAAFTPVCYEQAGILLPDSLQRAAPKRLGEFLAGRLAAREALRRVGLGDHVVAIGSAREPRWPAGFEGSISHSLLQGSGMALCAVRRGQAGIGLDLEAWLEDGQACELWPGIVNDEEWGRLQRCPLGPALGLTLVFSAKESLFKALYPRVGRYFDFLDARWLAMTEQTLTLELKSALTPELPVGWHCTLHWQRLPGGVLTTLVL